MFYRDVRVANPALDCNPDHNIILTVPFPCLRTVKAKRGDSEIHADVVLVCMTDSSELQDRFFEAKEENFLNKGWLARVPQPIIDQQLPSSREDSLVQR